MSYQYTNGESIDTGCFKKTWRASAFFEPKAIHTGLQSAWITLQSNHYWRVSCHLRAICCTSSGKNERPECLFFSWLLQKCSYRLELYLASVADGKTLKVQVAIGYSSWPGGMEQSIVMLENDILPRSPCHLGFISGQRWLPNISVYIALMTMFAQGMKTF